MSASSTTVFLNRKAPVKEIPVTDSPGEILYYVPTRTGQKSTQNINIGLSMTISVPLDKKAMQQCKESVALHNEYRTQVIANKRLDFEIAAQREHWQSLLPIPLHKAVILSREKVRGWVVWVCLENVERGLGL